MKNKSILLVLGVIIFQFSLNATVWTVNNNDNASADYALLQNAIDIAATGDTLYISGSPYTYDDGELIRLNKQLTIIGPGYFLGENENTQSSNQTAKIYEMEIGEGADNSLLMGLDFLSSSRDLLISKDKRDGSNGTVGPQNITLRRNLISYMRLLYANATIIEQNYFSRYGNFNIYLNEDVSSTIIQNNIFAKGGNGSNIYAGYYELSNTVVRNNILSEGLYRLHGIEISNNIFLADGFNDCDNNTVKNNVFVIAEAEAVPSGSTGNTLISNVFSALSSELFVEATLSVDNDYILKPSSPAEGVGIDGIDAGAFGGINSYKLSGLPSIPSVYELTTNGIGTKEDGLKVTIKARSNY